MGWSPGTQVRKLRRGPGQTVHPACEPRIVQQYWSLAGAGRGALLRWEWLYRSLITKWRWQRDRGAVAGLSRERGRPRRRSWGPRADSAPQADDPAEVGDDPQGERDPGQLVGARGGARGRLRDRWERGGAMVVSTATEMGLLVGTSRG